MCRFDSQPCVFNSNQAKRKKLSAMDNSKKSGPLLISGLLSPWILKRDNEYIPVEERNMITEFHRFTTEEVNHFLSKLQSRKNKT